MARAFRYLTVDEVLQLHAVEVGPDLVLHLDCVEACVGSPQQTFDGDDLYPSLADKAAALAHGLVNGHCFVDGNKRVAALALVLFVGMNGCKVGLGDAGLYDLITGAAAGDVQQDDLARALADTIIEPPEDYH